MAKRDPWLNRAGKEGQPELARDARVIFTVPTFHCLAADLQFSGFQRNHEVDKLQPAGASVQIWRSKLGFIKKSTVNALIGVFLIKRVRVCVRARVSG